ncbi:allophanate hydrolase [Pedosphaera parvula]|uniref:Allophanate hydrolase n=1 Tax=Pedosphaera parvula (strain Ellin514) TaxID=320771 RepID=B9XA73_PEDPL|nr:allophanate hydrolase [Pedosphaera parvula]EEF63414.1 allophanate hydrolase [Pedosphaera parvula Ellin514]
MNDNTSANDWSKRVHEKWQSLQASADGRVWICMTSAAQLENQLTALEKRRLVGEKLPLLGLTFAAKDNIDALGFPTTAGCPAYSYQPAENASVVQNLEAAGAVILGKTAMDQFATGLVGVRSPQGPCPNAFNPEYISGGSSSGSAVAVARGQVDFSLGTDTAGSGRVPAAFNGLIGYKPTLGIISGYGVVPACRSLDTVSIFSKSVSMAALVAAVARRFDPRDAYSRHCSGKPIGSASGGFKFGVPSEKQLEFFGDAEAPKLFAAAVQHLESIGGEKVSIDYGPLAEAASLLYQGPWVAERFAAVGEWIEANSDACDPTVAKIILGAKNKSALETFRAMYRLKDLQQVAAKLWSQCDFLMVPTAPASYRIAEVLASPIELNTRLGYYNNFVNLLDLAAVAVPTGFWSSGVSFGVNLIGPAFTDDALLHFASRYMNEQPPVATNDERISLAVVGAHLRGQPLHHQLTTLNAEFVKQTTTAPSYRLHALPGTVPPKPGLERVSDGGSAIELEVYRLNPDAFGNFVGNVPPPLCIGSVELADKTWVKGFLCESVALQGALDISRFGGWRAYRQCSTTQ